MFNSDRASLGVVLVDKDGTVTPFGERLINRIIERILADIYIGSGVPDVSLGDNGDIYINLAASTFYTKASDVWGVATALGNLSTNAVNLVGP